MKKTYEYKPVKFFIITYLITWVSWFLSAYFSYLENGKHIYAILIIPGGIAPLAVALWMILSSKDATLKKSFIDKLFNLRLIRPSSIPAVLFIMPAVVVVSILLSTLCGQSIGQLRMSGSFSFSSGFIPPLLIVFAAACFEEIGWRGYGMDSLLVKRNYFSGTMIFSFLWAFWHFPLFFIKGYYHNELINMNILYAINFMVSVFPMAFIISWICRRNSGSITAAILFHFVINISQEATLITSFTKCLETVVLIVIAAVIVLLNKEMFFGIPKRAGNE